MKRTEGYLVTHQQPSIGSMLFSVFFYKHKIGIETFECSVCLLANKKTPTPAYFCVRVRALKLCSPFFRRWCCFHVSLTALTPRAVQSCDKIPQAWKRESAATISAGQRGINQSVGSHDNKKPFINVLNVCIRRANWCVPREKWVRRTCPSPFHRLDVLAGDSKMANSINNVI